MGLGLIRGFTHFVMKLPGQTILHPAGDKEAWRAVTGPHVIVHAPLE
jgi:hypothetical protein